MSALFPRLHSRRGAVQARGKPRALVVSYLFFYVCSMCDLIPIIRVLFTLVLLRCAGLGAATRDVFLQRSGNGCPALSLAHGRQPSL